VKLFGALVLCLVLAGCGGTMTPDLSRSSSAPLVDDSTPPQYPKADNGFLGFHDANAWLSPNGKTEASGAPISGTVFGVLTPNKRAEYNTLIAQHAVRFLAEHAVQLHADDGVTPWTDSFGNALFRIDVQHTTYLGWLEIYKRNPNLYPVDTVLQKVGVP
jgi:hypothetical protein